VQRTVISYKNSLDHDKAKSVLAKLSYSIEDIMNCYLDEKNSEIIIETERESADCARVAEHLIQAELQRRVFKPRVIRNNNGRSEERDQLEVSEVFSVDFEHWITLPDQGQRVISLLLAYIDAMADPLGAKRRVYPAMIPRETMEKCGYLHTFPQNLYLVNQFPHNFDVLNAVRSADSIDLLTRPSEYVLSPAVCFHCYREFTNAELPDGVVVSADGTCFRHEAAWRVNHFRRKEFKMREIVYFGSEPTVQRIRLQLLDKTWEWFNALRLTGKIETASDPFYFIEDHPKASHQLFHQMKYELVVMLGNGESFALASFNIVGGTLCEAFNIRVACTREPYSGCAAFGLERWAYALYVQYGPDMERWPRAIRKTLTANESKRITV